MDDSQINALRKMARDYTDTLHKIVFVLGRCDETACEIFQRYAAHYDVEETEADASDHEGPDVITVSVPVQVIPELVHALAQRNIAVYLVTPV